MGHLPKRDCSTQGSRWCPNSTELGAGSMLTAVYNSAIPKRNSNTVNPAFRVGFRVASLWLAGMFLAAASQAADWSVPEQNLPRKVVAVTGPGAVALTIENRSSLGKRDSEIIRNGLRSALEASGLRMVKDEQAAATVSIWLSENAISYVWVAEIRQGAGDAAVVMVSTPRPEGSAAARDSVLLSLRKTSLWTQSDPILDVAVLEENPTPTRIAVLDPEKVSLYRQQ